MNFKTFLLLVCATACVATHTNFTLPQFRKNSSIFQGSVKFPATVQALPQLSILYKGNEYKIEVDQEGSGNKGYFEVYEQSDCKELYVLVTESLQSPKLNSVKCLQTSQSYPYKLYKLTRSTKTIEQELEGDVQEKSQQKRTLEYWAISECDAQKKELDLADNTLIFLMDANVVAGLKEESWDAGDNLIKLPTIVFQESLETATLQDIAARVACAWIDVKFMHTKLSMSEKITNDRKLVMPSINTTLSKTQQPFKPFSYG